MGKGKILGEMKESLEELETLSNKFTETLVMSNLLVLCVMNNKMTKEGIMERKRSDMACRIMYCCGCFHFLCDLCLI